MNEREAAQVNKSPQSVADSAPPHSSDTLHTLPDASMESCFRALCMTFVLASFARRSGAVGPMIKCEPCDVGARLLCKPLPKDCAEKVREPGCGCCMTCALSAGQPCGVYTGRCGSGLSCQHQPGETKPLQALLEGRGICANATNKRISARPTPPVNELPGKSRALTFLHARCVKTSQSRFGCMFTRRNGKEVHLFTFKVSLLRLGAWIEAFKVSKGVVRQFNSIIFGRMFIL